MLTCLVPIFTFENFWKIQRVNLNHQNIYWLSIFEAFIFSVDQLLPNDKIINYDYYLHYFGLIKTLMESVIMVIKQSQYD